MEWSQEMIARLRGFWTEGYSTAEIGRRMGVSKNAIIGKAHRLALPGRPSPIRLERSPGQPRRHPAPRRVIGPTLPPLATASVIGQAPVKLPPAVTVPVGAPTTAGEPALAGKPRAISLSRRLGARQIPCCWPIGDPGTPKFRFCDAVALPGKPYCDEHAQVAYVRVKDHREDAA